MCKMLGNGTSNTQLLINSLFCLFKIIFSLFPLMKELENLIKLEFRLTKPTGLCQASLLCISVKCTLITAVLYKLVFLSIDRLLECHSYTDRSIDQFVFSLYGKTGQFCQENERKIKGLVLKQISQCQLSTFQGEMSLWETDSYPFFLSRYF